MVPPDDHDIPYADIDDGGAPDAPSDSTRPESEEGEPRRRKRSRRGRRRRRRDGDRPERNAAAESGKLPASAADEGEVGPADELDEIPEGMTGVDTGDGNAQGHATEGDETTATGERPRRRKRRRRRRDGGRDRHESATSSGPGAESDEEDDSDEADLAYGQLSGDDEEPVEEGDLSRTSHRNIPTWQEAVGLIVDGNIAARQKGTRPPGHSNGPRRRRGGRR